MAMQTISTETVRAQERLSFWQETVCSGLVRVDCQRTERFSGQLTLGASGETSVAELRACPHVTERDRRLVSSDGSEEGLLFVQIDGTMGFVTGDEQFTVQPGAMFFYDLRMPGRLIFSSDFRHLAFRAPRRRFVRDDGRAPRSFLIANRSHLRHVATAASRALFTRDSYGDGAPPGEEDAIDAVVDLLGETIAEGDPMSFTSPAEQAITRRFLQILAVQLADPNLNAQSLAGELGVTTQYLNRVLARSGSSIATRILATRLDRCARDLRMGHATRIGEVAFRWGFNDLSHFSRVFKSAYGVSPRDYRARRLI